MPHLWSAYPVSQVRLETRLLQKRGVGGRDWLIKRGKETPSDNRQTEKEGEG